MKDLITINYGNFIITFGVGALTATGIIFWILNNPDKIERIFALIYRTFSWVSKKLEYGKISTNIQAAVNSASNEVNRDCPEILPYAMKIKWAKTSQDTETFLRNGEIIVTMDYSRNDDRNLVVSTLAYIEKGLLPIARSYVDETLMKATDFTVAKTIFTSNYGGLSMNYFLQNYLKPEVNNDSQLQKDCTLLDSIHKAGFLSKIYLRQIHHFGNKIYPATPDQATKKESQDFAIFLDKIATRKGGEEVNLTFAQSRIRINVLLIAQDETKIWGIGAYLRRIKINLDRGIEYTYICARGPENVSLAQEIATKEEKNGHLKIISKHNFLQPIENKEVSAIVIVCAMNLLTAPGTKAGPFDKRYRIIKENVKELREGQVEVVSAAILPGAKSKIAVRSLIDNLNPVSCFTEQSRLSTMESYLGGERLEFIRWSNDPKSLIIDSLTPLNPNKVIKIEIDAKRKQAIIKVDGWKAKRKALGRGDQNINCAMELTGWQIAVEEIPKEDIKHV